jgi:hypothetical protein
LRSAYNIDEKCLRVRLHLHHYHNVARVRGFWSKLLGIPKTQFEKIYIKSRKKTKKKRKNFAGICFLKYGKGGVALQKEVLYFIQAVQQKFVPMRP